MKDTQAERILKVLREANGEYVNGRYFLNNLMLSQYHARIHELQRKGYVIEASRETDQFGFKSYKLISEPFRFEIVDGLKQGTLV